jgi:hypothetical protein
VTGSLIFSASKDYRGDALSPKSILANFMSHEKLITAENIAERKKFLEFTDADIQILVQIHQ